MDDDSSDPALSAQDAAVLRAIDTAGQADTEHTGDARTGAEQTDEAQTGADGGRAPSTRRVAELLAAGAQPIGLGTEPWWGLETQARALERRGLVTVLSVRDELKDPARAMRTTDDYGLALTDRGREALRAQPDA